MLFRPAAICTTTTTTMLGDGWGHERVQHPNKSLVCHHITSHHTGPIYSLNIVLWQYQYAMIFDCNHPFIYRDITCIHHISELYFIGCIFIIVRIRISFKVCIQAEWNPFLCTSLNIYTNINNGLERWQHTWTHLSRTHVVVVVVIIHPLWFTSYEVHY